MLIYVFYDDELFESEDADLDRCEEDTLLAKADEETEAFGGPRVAAALLTVVLVADNVVVGFMLSKFGSLPAGNL